MRVNLLRQDIMGKTLADYVAQSREALATSIQGGDFADREVHDYARELIRMHMAQRESELGWHQRKAAELSGGLAIAMLDFVAVHWPEVEHYQNLLWQWDETYGEN